MEPVEEKLSVTETGESPQEQAFSRAAIMLLKGVVSRGQDEALWQEILNQKTSLQDYFHRIGLVMVIDEMDEFAWLKQAEDSGLPRLVPRYPLSYNLSMLLVQLRKMLGEHNPVGMSGRVIVRFDDILRCMEPFLPVQANEMKVRQTVEHLVRAAVRMGFLLRIKEGGEDYEVRPVLRHFVDAQWLDEFARKLEEYEALGRERHCDGEGRTDVEEGGLMDEFVRNEKGSR